MLGVLDSRVTLSLSVSHALCEDYCGAAGQKIAGSKKSLLKGSFDLSEAFDFLGVIS